MTTTTAFPNDRRARGLAIESKYENFGAAGTRFRPVRVAVIGLGEDGVTYTTVKAQVFSARAVGEVYGYKSELYGAVSQLLPVNGDGVGSIPVTVYPIAQPVVGPVKAAGIIAVTGSTATKAEVYKIKINNVAALDVVTAVGDKVADFCDKAVEAINAVIGIPMTATDGDTHVDLTAGWSGATGNDLHIDILRPADAEFSYTLTQPTGGAGTISLAAALAQVGGIWETHIVNCAGPVTAILNELQDFGVGRDLPEVHKPCVAISGINTTSVVTCAAITDARKTDYVNNLEPNPGSNDMPWVIAARATFRMAKSGNSDPATDYCLQKLNGLTPGPDGDQWTSAQRDYAVKKGLSTVEVIDGVVCMSDTVTMYHPTGEEPPAYAYVCDLQKLGTVIYNDDLIFGQGGGWPGAPLVPDNQAVKNPNAKKPKMGLSALSKLDDTLADDAIISDPDFSRANSSVGIGTSNPKRFDVVHKVKLSGNANVISINLSFGFYYGV